MPARLRCDGCGKLYQVRGESLAKTLRCPNCGSLMHEADPSRATAAPPPSAPPPRAPAMPPPLPPMPPPLPAGMRPLPVLPIDAPVPALPVDQQFPPHGFPPPSSGSSWQVWLWGGGALILAVVAALGVLLARQSKSRSFAASSTVTMSPITVAPTPPPRYVPPPAPQQPRMYVPPQPTPPRPVYTPPPRPPMPSTRPAGIRTTMVGPVFLTVPSNGAYRGRTSNGVRNVQLTPYLPNSTTQADYAFFMVAEPQVEMADNTPPLKEGDKFCSVSDWGVGPKATVDTVNIKGINYTRVREGEVDRCYSAYIDGQKVTVFHTSAATDNADAGAKVRAIVESIRRRPTPTTRPIPR